MSPKATDRLRDVGLLVLRVGLGAMFVMHGFPKLAGGPAKWATIGAGMRHLGLAFAPTFWGFMAGLAEMGGGICLILGLFVRPAAAMMAFTMLVAFLGHMAGGDKFTTWSHAAEDGVVFLALVLTGAGAFSLDARLWGRNRQKR